MDEPVRVIGAGQTELRAQRERALDAPADQRAVDLREAVGGDGHHAEPRVVGIGEREPDLVAALVGEPDVLARRQREIA